MMAMVHSFQMRTRIARESRAGDIIGGGKRRPWGIEWSCHLYHPADSPEMEYREFRGSPGKFDRNPNQISSAHTGPKSG